MVAALVSLKRSYSAPILENLGLCIGNCETHADRQGGKLIHRIAAGAPIGKLLSIKALGDVRMPFTGYRPDYRIGVELAAINAHRAAEVAADIKYRLDDRIAREAWWDRFEIGDFPGRAVAGHSVPPRVGVRSCSTREKTLCFRFIPISPDHWGRPWSQHAYATRDHTPHLEGLPIPNRDIRKCRVFGLQLDGAIFHPITLDREGTVEQRQHDIAIDGRAGAVDDRDIARKDAGPGHAVALDADSEGRRRMLDQQLVEIEWPVDIVLGRRRKSAGRRPRHHWNAQRRASLDTKEGSGITRFVCRRELARKIGERHRQPHRFGRRLARPSGTGARSAMLLTWGV